MEITPVGYAYGVEVGIGGKQDEGKKTSRQKATIQPTKAGRIDIYA